VIWIRDMLINDKNIILASSSTVRHTILINAGIQCSVIPSHINETKIKQKLIDEGKSFKIIAMELARAKAKQISKDHLNSIIIGADQMLICGDQSFDKPKNQKGCIKTLQQLSGKRHRLISSVCLLHNKNVIGEITEYADLTMRDLSLYKIHRYIDQAGEGIYSSVGAYHYEKVGIQLFNKIEGDYFTILGLPLIQLLDVLRQLNSKKA